MKDNLGLPDQATGVELLPNGQLRVPITLLVPASEEIEVKATEPNLPKENRISSVWVGVFANDGSGTPQNSDLLVQLAKGAINGNTSGAMESVSVSVDLNEYPNPCYLVVLTNLTGSAKTTLESVATYSQLQNIQIGLDQIYQSTQGGASSNLQKSYPMSSDGTYLAKIDMTIATPVIDLYLVSSRIDIITALSDSEFLLSGATLHNGAKEGCLLHRTPVSQNLGGISAPYQEIPAETSQTIRPMYLYPNNGSSPISNPTCIIVRGQAAGHEEGYYKIAIKYTKGGADSYDIDRNKLYKINITKVTGSGYKTMQGAIENTPHNIEYDVTVSDQGMSDLVISNGQYYLGLSNSEVWFYGFNPSTYVTLAQIRVGTSAGNSLPIQDRVLTPPATIANVDNLILTTDPSGTTSTNNISNIVEGTTYYIRGRIKTSFIQETIKIRFGNLTKEIFIKSNTAVQDVATSIPVNDVLLGEIEYNEDNNFLRLNTSNIYPNSYQPRMEGNNGTLYLCTPGIYTIESDFMSRISEVFLTRSQDKGKLKIVIKQDLPGVNSYMFPITGGAFRISAKRVNEYWNQEWRDNFAVGSGNIFCATDAQKQKLSDYPNWVAEVLWGDIPLTGITVVKSTDAKGINITIPTNLNSGKGGNVIICVRKATGGEILWSWHIWVTDFVKLDANNKIVQNGTLFTSNTGIVMMDRNLGARTNSQSNTSDSYGLYYQWGRKDPFPGASVYNTNAESTIYTPSGSALYGSGGVYGEKVYNTNISMAESIRSPLTYSHYMNSSNIDWIGVSADAACQKMNRWLYNPDRPAGTDLVAHQNIKGFKTIYDPCPKGYRLGWGTDWSGMPSLKTGCTWGGNGYTWSYNFQSTWMPTAGYRDSANGNLSFVGRSGIYWSGSPYDEKNFRCTLALSSGSVHSYYGNHLTLGSSIRPVQE